MEHCGQGRVCIYYAVKKQRHYLDDTEILLKSDAKSLQKFLAGRTNNVKLDRWSLELQGRNIQVDTYLVIKNTAANCLFWLPFATRKRNNNPLKNEDASINETQVEVGKDCCPLYEVEWTNMKATV